jgi:hypothetical protein
MWNEELASLAPPSTRVSLGLAQNMVSFASNTFNYQPTLVYFNKIGIE